MGLGVTQAEIRLLYDDTTGVSVCLTLVSSPQMGLLNLTSILLS
jgi:hypothetical protein